MAEPMIKMAGVAKSFDSQRLLNSISFQVERGERVSVVGPGGCGKTTIFKLLLGILSPDEGQVELFGSFPAALAPQERERIMRQVGVAFQQGALFDFMTVGENLAFAMEYMTSMSTSEIDTRIDELLSRVKLHRTRDLVPSELSGGMRRRVGIARALATRPTLAFFDEPTAGLDPVTSTLILNMILELGQEAGQQRTLIVATSNVEIAVRFAPRIIVVNNGAVVADGPWRELLVNSDPWVQHFLGVRFIGLDRRYAEGLDLPREFMSQHWA